MASRKVLLGMRKTPFIVCCSLVMLFAAMTANADTVAMGYTGPQGNNSGGEYTYPYNFTINGSSTNYPLMCNSFANSVSPGQGWDATTLTVDNLNAVNVLGLEFPSAGLMGYLEASYLFVEEATAYTNGNSDPSGLYNWAVWDLFTGTDPSGSRLSAADEATVQGYLNDALALGGSLTPSQFPNVVIYTPTDVSAGGPQEFFGYSTPFPEPTSLSLLGFGGLALLRRRR